MAELPLPNTTAIRLWCLAPQGIIRPVLADAAAWPASFLHRGYSVFARLLDSRFWSDGKTSTRTSATPFLLMLSVLPAAAERSNIRCRTYGPRSFTRTLTTLPVDRFVTLTTVPRGKVLCAAVNWWGLKCSPLAVGRPSFSRPYHDAKPTCAKVRWSDGHARDRTVPLFPACASSGDKLASVKSTARPHARS